LKLLDAGLEQLRAKLISAAKDRAIKAITKSAPWFILTPGVGTLTNMLIDWVLDKVYDEAEVLAYWQLVDLVKNSQNRTAHEKAEAFYKNPTSETKQALIDAARDLVRLRLTKP
jgi:hypothetical protein